MARIAVVGLAKSGTTGLWSTLARSYPGSYQHIFEGQELPSRFTKYLGKASRALGINNCLSKEIIGPDFDFEKALDFDKIIWMVRDPRDRLISYILYRHYDYRYHDDDFIRSQLSLLIKKEKDPDSVSLLDIEANLLLPKPDDYSAFFWNDSKKWKILEEQELKNKVFILKYEKFVDQDFSELEEFLKIKINKNNSVPDQFKRVVRTKGYNFWKNWFTDKDCEYYEPLFDFYLNRYYYENDWVNTSVKRINSKDSSEYVIKIVNERRIAEGLKPITS
tara:strand:- start:703 stop:1533 length:831 start_codon:yes stop_codon:yes gene_type:complete